jgi:LAS superfamily LD-carboxypeptidase LdcB
MCAIGGGHLLRCDAAAAFNAMNFAHFTERGYPLVITDGYRDYAAQVDLRQRKPHLAATPGQSNHGWGLAIDLAVGGWNGEVFRWLHANAHLYGWYHPLWARIDGSKPEPWHWEYATGE